jgi:hypothetical protein
LFRFKTIERDIAAQHCSTLALSIFMRGRSLIRNKLVSSPLRTHGKSKQNR